MDYVALFIACFLAFMATIIKYFGGEGMIAGYNTSSKAEQEYMSKKGIGAFVGNYIYCMALVLLGGFLAKKAGFIWGIDVSWGFFMVIIFVMVFRGQRFAPPADMVNPKSAKIQKIGLIIGAIITLAVIGNVTWATLPSHYTFSSDAMQISGAYGMRVAYSNIDRVRLEQDIPSVGTKINGLGMGAILKGHFMVDKVGKCCLFLRSAEGPVIIITFKNRGEPLLINMPDPAQTRHLYQEEPLLINMPDPDQTRHLYQKIKTRVD